MKRLLIIAMFVLGLSSCSKSYPIRNSPDSMANQFINLEKITELYLVFISGNKDKGGITPIAEPEGTFLTYQEWKERNKTYGKENQE